MIMKFAHFSHVWNKPGMTPFERYEQLWRELVLCDQLDFDYGFAVEHHFNPAESWMPSPSIYCMGAGARTRKLRVGPMGYIVPLHSPLRMVEEVAVLDQALGGRLELGLVPGIVPAYFQPYGADYQNRRAITLEMVRLLNTAYRAEGIFDFDGPFFKFKDVHLSVLPLQRPRPPLWFETRDPETLTVLAREGVDTGYFFFLPRDEGARRYRDYLRHWQDAGWERKPRIAYLTVVYVDETDDLAKERAMPHVVDAFRRFLTFGGEGDIEELQRRQGEFFEQRGEHGAAEIIRNMLDPDFLLERELVFVGSPATVASQIKQAATLGMFNVMFCELNFGALAEEDLMRSIRLFASGVMPELKHFEPF
jgi:alkanesulfonate monooxygenase SsuD/methylene tetrahydromethanopterin reductase-like flavin-dependent oxidoreductase (luciferase family)